MSDANAQEPTMEEILASIRRIISEDDAPAAEGPNPQPSPDEPVAAMDEVLAAIPTPEPLVLDDPEPEEEDILELVDPVEPPPPPMHSLGDLDIAPREEPRPAPAAPPPLAAAALEPAEETEESLLSAPAAGLAASYFGSLSRTLSMPAEGRTLEDLVSDLMRPLLKEWLDQHLPSIVEAKVQAEVERLARARR